MKLSSNEIRYIIAEEISFVLEEQASKHASKIAELIMSGHDQFETVAHFIRMGVAPMEEISAAIVEKYNKMLPELADLEHIVKAGYDSYADPEADTDLDAMRKATQDIEKLKIPFYNVFQFWYWANDPDTDKGMATDIRQEVDKLLDIKELYKIVPGLEYYARGGEGSGVEDPFFEGQKKMNITTKQLKKIIKEEIKKITQEGLGMEIPQGDAMFDMVYDSEPSDLIYYGVPKLKQMQAIIYDEIIEAEKAYHEVGADFGDDVYDGFAEDNIVPLQQSYDKIEKAIALAIDMGFGEV